MHFTWKPAILAIQTCPASTHTSLVRSWKWATMPVYTMDVVTLHALLTWSLARDHTQTVELGLVQLDVVAVWTLLQLSSIEVAATVHA